MRKLQRSVLLVLLTILSLTSCNQTEIDQVANAVSNLCNGITGAEAIYWDLENGIIRTDLPGGIPPTVDNIGGVFSHQGFPLLGFNYPVGWTPEQLAGQGIVGVNLYRNDNQAIWRSLAYPANFGTTITDVRDFEITGVKDFFQLPQAIETVCFNEQTQTVVDGINITVSNIMFRSGGTTAVVIASLTWGNAIIQPQANVKVAAAPTNDFPAEVFDTFLAIEWQLLVGNPDNFDDDRDNDGVPNIYDADPDDPNVQ